LNTPADNAAKQRRSWEFTEKLSEISLGDSTTPQNNDWCLRLVKSAKLLQVNLQDKEQHIVFEGLPQGTDRLG